MQWIIWLFYLWKTKPNSANILLFKSGYRMSHSNGGLRLPGHEEISWLPKEKAQNRELTEILIQERTVTIFAALRPEQHMAAQLTNIIFSSFFFPISHAHFICGILKLHTKCLLTPWHHRIPPRGCAVYQDPHVPLWEGYGQWSNRWWESISFFPASARKRQLSEFSGRIVFMLENLQCTGFKINLLLPCIPGPFRLPNRTYFLKQLYLQIAIRRAQVPVHCTFTALWWPLYWRMKVCTFDLSKTGNLFKFFHFLHASMWALAYMVLWPAQTVEQWFSIFPMV